MNKVIIVVGATGNLGTKIVDALLAKGATVKAIVRLETSQQKINSLKEKGVEVCQVDTTKVSEIANCCAGAHCMVSALSGLKETIIDAQLVFIQAAIEAKVPRFIPSDYSIDFLNLTPGQNRNLDFRRDFHSSIEKLPIQVSSIFNGAFMELLTTDMPLILLKQKRILCWGNANQVLEFTTTHNIAKFTAEVALDNNTPRYLKIAGDTLTCNDFVYMLSKSKNTKFKLFKPGGIGLLNTIIKITRFFSPSKTELYPAWQGMQYMRDMMEGRIIFSKYENEKYQNIKWTKVDDFLKQEKFI
jgi:hypothetical protein